MYKGLSFGRVEELQAEEKGTREREFIGGGAESGGNSGDGSGAGCGAPVVEDRRSVEFRTIGEVCRV